MEKVNEVYVPLAFGCGILLMLTQLLLTGQTQIDANTQIKNLTPIASVERSQCVGSGTTTTTPPTSWNCAGLQMYRITLTDGTVLGPYIAIPATTQQSSLALWQSLPLTSPDPTVTAKKK